MKKNISERDFVRAFEDMGRASAWTSFGLAAMYDYLCEFERDTGSEIELDPVAIDCDFSEYESTEVAAEDIGCSEREVKENTVAEHRNGVIVRNW